MRSPSHRRAGGPRPVLISVVLHILLGIALIQVFLIPYPYFSYFHRPRAEPPPTERLSYVATPAPAGAPPSAERGSGNGRPVITIPAVPLVAPTSVPRTIPVAPVAPGPPVEATPAGTGPVVGTGGPVQGVQPQYHDGRVWVPAAPMGGPPKTAKQRMDSVVASEIDAHNDSMALVSGRKPGDWTFKHNGQKYGIDQQFIHLGPVSIPTAVLALLPLNVQANPMAGAAEQMYNLRRGEINDQAQRGMDEDAFRTAVRKLRERNDLQRQHEKEQQQQQQQQPQQKQPPAPATIANDGG